MSQNKKLIFAISKCIINKKAVINIKKIDYKVTKEDSGKKIKVILKNKLDISASVLTELKKYPDGIMLNKESVFATHVAMENDVISITLQDKKSPNIVPNDLPLDIIYEDDDLLVVNKPRLMPSHPSQNHHDDTLANAVMYRYSDFTFRIITRLDKNTSGVVVIAKNKICASRLTKQMTQSKIQKEYIAICHGIPKNKKGTINSPISRKENSVIMREVNPDGKEAVTKYETILTKDNLSLLHIKPITGRTHQIRVHLSYIGNPIYGDDMYGSPISDTKCLLHCQKVTLTHPETSKKISFEAKAPKDMEFIYN